MRGILITILLFMMPMLLEVGIIWKRNISKREKGIRCIFVMVIVNSIGMLFYLSYKKAWTVYEYSLLYIIISLVVTMLVLPLVYKEFINIEKILSVFCLIVISVVIYSILTYGQTNIHSDVATASLLAQCQIRNKKVFPLTWCYGNGEIWVLGLNLFVMPFSILLKNQSLARMLGSVLITVAALAAVYYQSKKTFKNNSWFLSIPVLLSYLYGSLDAVLYQAAYIGQILWIALTCSITSMIFHGIWKKRYVFCLAIIMILLCMGSIRQIAENTIPLWGACMLLIYIQNKGTETIEECKDGLKQSAFISALLLFSSFIGFGIYKILCISHSVIDTGANELQFVASLNDCWNNMIAVFINIFGDFGYTGSVNLFSIYGIRNLISIFICMFIVFIIPVLQLIKIEEESESIVFFYVFGMLHNMIMLIVAVFCGKTEGRYMLTSVFVSVMIAAQYVCNHWLIKDNLLKKVITFCFIFASSFQCIFLLKLSAGWQDVLITRKAFAQELLLHDLHKGYASYWYAYTNEVYSDLQLQMGGININESGIVPYYWLVDSDVFHVEDTNTFLLLNQEEKEAIGSNILTLFGNPIEEFSVGEMYVYVFGYDIMIKAIP